MKGLLKFLREQANSPMSVRHAWWLAGVTILCTTDDMANRITAWLLIALFVFL